MLKGSIPKLDNFNGDPQSTKISFHVWEKQVMALEGDYTPASIRTAIRNSLKGRALQDISILPPEANWKVLLETLRIKYQHKASYDSMLSVFYGLQITSAEDCAAFSSKLEQKLSYVQAMYPEELNTKQYWHLLRERFFHGLPVNLRTNIRSEYEKGVDYYTLLQAARMIESELRADPQFKTVDKTELKGDKKPKAKGAATNLFGADKELTHPEKAWSETANEMKAMQKTLQDITTCIGHLQQNRSPQPIPPANNVDLTKGVTTPKGEGGSIEVEGVEIEAEVKTFIKIDLPYVDGARAMLVEKKPNIEFRIVLFTKNAGRIGGRHTQPIQTPPFLVILSRRKTRKGIH